MKVPTTKVAGETLRDIANRHWLHGYEEFIRDLGGELRRFGTVSAFLGGIPLPFANGCLMLNQAAPRDLDAAIRWLKPANVPFLVRVDDSLLPGVMDVVEDHHLVAETTALPGMVMQPIPVPPPPAEGITIERVDHGRYDDFASVLVATGMPEQWAERAFPRHLIGRPDLALFVARMDGRAVGNSLAMRTGDLGGIYSVGTVEEARRRGVGTAVTWAAVDAIRRWGCTAAVLQSSEMGHPVYLKMGFVDATSYAQFKPAAATSREPVPGPEAGHEGQGQEGR